MNENKNFNWTSTERKACPTSLKETKSLGTESRISAEPHKARVSQGLQRSERGAQTKQMKEADAATHLELLANDEETNLQSCSYPLANTFKQTNQSKVVENNDANMSTNDSSEKCKLDSPGTENPCEAPKPQCARASSVQLRTRSLKSSVKEAPDANTANKIADEIRNAGVDEEMSPISDTPQDLPAIVSKVDELANKLRPDRKINQSTRNCANSKINDDQSCNELSESSEHDSEDKLQDKKLLKKKEKVCENWFKSIKIKEPIKNGSPSDSDRRNVREFCQNKICPFSETKIPRTPKIMKLAKKLVLHKTQIDNKDERWYCLRCLKAHNDSLFWLYCAQIYFEDDDELEGDGKPWIQWDKCEKWIHLDWDILVGKNRTLQKHYRDDNFSYLCPQCKPRARPKKRDLKTERKRHTSSARDRPDNQQSQADHNSSDCSNSVDKESLSGRNSPYRPGANADSSNSQADDVLRDESCCSQSDGRRKHGAARDAGRAYRTLSDEPDGDLRRRKQPKKSSSKTDKPGKLLKRGPDAADSPERRSHRETVEQFTKERSMRIAKEREDIVESRSLLMKVSMFCGLTTVQIHEKILHDLETISNAITYNEKTESEENSSSPMKNNQFGPTKNCKESSYLRNGDLSLKWQQETMYSRRLRTRRNQRLELSQN